MSSTDIQNVKTLIIIVLIVVAIVIIYKWIKHNLKHKDEVITAFTGGLGSGKTALTVDKAKALKGKNQRKLKYGRIWLAIKNLFKRKNKYDLDKIPKDIPIFSNIPIIVKKANRFVNFLRLIFKMTPIPDTYCQQLEKEHLLLQKRLPKGCIVAIDEIGAWANQFRFNDRNIIEVFDEFVRFYRHYLTIEELNIEPYMVVNDQCSENINLVVRRRLNVVHNLNNFFHIWRFCFYFERMITISEEIKTVDLKSGETVGGDTQDNSNFRWKFISSFGCYDSHCHSERYDSVPQGVDNVYVRKKCNDLLVCPSDKQKRYVPKTAVKYNNLKKEVKV